MFNLPPDGKRYHRSLRTLRHLHCCALAGHMLGIWVAYAISSHAVAYRSISPLMGPRLSSIMLGISFGYAKHMLHSPRFVQVVGQTPSTGQDKLFQRTGAASVLLLRSIYRAHTSPRQRAQQSTCYPFRGWWLCICSVYAKFKYNLASYQHQGVRSWCDVSTMCVVNWCLHVQNICRASTYRRLVAETESTHFIFVDINVAAARSSAYVQHRVRISIHQAVDRGHRACGVRGGCICSVYAGSILANTDWHWWRQWYLGLHMVSTWSADTLSGHTYAAPLVLLPERRLYIC
jgi:hypothetical protein